ncbi:MAG: stress protein [Gammaproteobacteria bacterium]|nr:stress protein [Gammaproteobacteria bacterium]|tara:strand:- start:5090 stop:5485 length:396 start_codon:yes stop_codon:yes gene_type:complete
MKKKYKFISFIVLLCLLTSPVIAENNISKDPVYHVILVWLKTYRNQERINKIIEATKELKNIPGVLEINAGKVLRSSRVIVDDTFDVGIIMKFASSEDLENYLIHPLHVKIANEVIKPLANRVVVYDTIIK